MHPQRGPSKNGKVPGRKSFVQKNRRRWRVPDGGCRATDSGCSLTVVVRPLERAFHANETKQNQAMEVLRDHPALPWRPAGLELGPHMGAGSEGHEMWMRCAGT